MDQTQQQQPRGDFVAFMNRDKQPGDNRPAFEGRISKPGAEDKHAMTLWAHEYTDPKTGEIKVMFNGQAEAYARNSAPKEQINALVRQSAEATEQALGGLKLAPRQVVLFPNGFKDEAPEKDRPDYWGAYNPGDGSPIVRSSVWLKNDRNGRAFLSGATSYPLPGKSEAEMQASEAGLGELIETGKVTKGMPKRSRGREE